MKVELSERARVRVERLVDAGEYASVEAAIEAAVEQLDTGQDELTDAEISALVGPAYDDIAAGRVRPAQDVIADAREMVRARAERQPGA